jgi:hypothetical protein
MIVAEGHVGQMIVFRRLASGASLAEVRQDRKTSVSP